MSRSHDLLVAHVVAILGPPALVLLASCGGERRETSTQCIAADVEATCPTDKEAAKALVGGHYGCPSRQIQSVVGFVGSEEHYTCDSAGVDTGCDRVLDPTMQDCCYEVRATVPDEACVDGRPLIDHGRAVVADGARRPDWAGEPRPSLERSPEARRRLAERWTRVALAEHASVGSFARFSLDLLAFGAPPELLDRAHEAAREEIVHARLCFALASAYAGEPVGPSALRQAPFATSATLADLAEAAAREGAINETRAVVAAARELRETTDPVVRRVLERIIADEARHAELAWDTLRWALDLGGAPVHDRLTAVFAALDDDETTSVTILPAAWALLDRKAA